MNKAYDKKLKNSKYIGQRFSKLTIIEFAGIIKNNSYWKVVCDCGTIKTVSLMALKSGGTKGCGCLRKQRKGKIVNCDNCSKPFYKSICFINKTNFCCKKCHHSFMQNRVTLNCLECNKEYKVAVSFYKSRGSKYCSNECKYKGMSKTRSGANSPFWKGGVSSKRIRKGIEWKTWRKAVFERDKYTCQECGAISCKGKSVELHPHHLKSYMDYPSLRFDISNGQTLCKDCHKKTPNYLMTKRMIEIKLLKSLRKQGFLVDDLLALSSAIDMNKLFCKYILNHIRKIKNG